MLYNEKFPVLSTIAKVLFVIGIAIAIVGALAGIAFFGELLKIVGHTGENWSFEPKDYIKIITFVLCLPGGLALMAFAESIGVLFGIEKNTRTVQKEAN